MGDERRTLIVNADDYGLTDGVSEGILQAHRAGIVTSTSVIALGSAFSRSVGRLADEPELGVGAHLALVGEDPPLLSASEIPTLVDRNGDLAISWRRLLPRVAGGRVDLADVEREMRAQLEVIESAGVRLDHLDTHQHLHLWPSIGDVVVRLARERELAVRVPRSAGRGPTGAGVRRLTARLEGSLSAADVRFPGASVGLDGAGRMTLEPIERAVDRLDLSGKGVAELSVHPGVADDPQRHRYRWGYEWSGELEALVSSRARAVIERSTFTLGTYASIGNRA
jgi:predicted glycoside hydrolase/deacetylase ChbG (UPF0249 family)